MYDVFISYRRDTGKDLASSFVQLIKNHGYVPYFDIDDHATGEFRNNIREAISKSQLFILIVTEGSIERFQNPEDISRLEVEYALECGLKILPISSIGENIFKEIKKYAHNLPKSITNLTNHNVELYQHELQTNTQKAILQNLEKIQRGYFGNKENAKQPLSQEYNLFDFIESVEKYRLTIDSEDYLYTGVLKFKKPYGKGLFEHVESGSYFEITVDLCSPYYGVGKHFQNNKLVYEGQFYSFKYSGEGIFYEENGKYTGHFLNGKKQGKGVQVFKDNTKFEGYWIGDEFRGPFIKYIDNKTRYNGEVSDNQPHGIGEKIENDMIFNGRFRNGQFIDGIIQLEDKIIKGDFTYNRMMMIFNKNHELMYEGNLNNFQILGEGKLYIQAKLLTELNIPSEMIEVFATNLSDFEKLDLVIHANFIGEKEIDLEKEVKITERKDGLKIISGHLKKGKPLFIYVNGKQIECNPLNIRETKNMIRISSDFRVRDY